MTAAIAAARNGATVVIAEQMDRVGKKLLATGNGRCNLSNTSIHIHNYHGKNVTAIQPIFNQYGSDFVIQFFKSLGLLIREEECGRLYPRTFQASTVLDVLRAELTSLNVSERCMREAVSIIKENDTFITQFNTGECYHSEIVILTTGGMASPAFGSNGSGYKIMSALGHSAIPPLPALVQLKLQKENIPGLKGIRISAAMSLFYKRSNIENQLLYEETGELLFTDYGITGIPILNASGYLVSTSATRSFYASKKSSDSSLWANHFYIMLDLFPELDHLFLKQYFLTRRDDIASRSLDQVFIGLLHKRLTIPLLKYAGIVYSNTKKIGALTDAEIEKLADVLKNWKHPLNGTLNFNSAQISNGGLFLDDFNLNSLESKKISGLYAAGEILDVAGDCGGYNLHWSWVSGYIAGISSAKALLRNDK